MAEKNLGVRPGELLVDFWNADYNFVSSVITNQLGETVTVDDPVGQPVKLNGSDWELVDDADLANATGVIVDGPKIDSLADTASTDESDQFLILTRGPAVVNEDELATVDAEGDALTLSTFRTALNGLSPRVETVSGPSLSETGTT